MKNSSEPSVHRVREQKLIEHVKKLLSDDRLSVNTTAGKRSITTLVRDVTESNRALDVKRAMSEVGLYDRELQNRMPVGEAVEVTLGKKVFFVFRKSVGRMRVICASPTVALLKGDTPEPMSATDAQRVFSQVPPSLGHLPQTIVLMSTSGFSPDARELVESSGGRQIVLVEPNDAGGWDVHAPAGMEDLADLFDPEDEAEKRARVRDEIDAAKLDLLTGGLSVEKLAARTKVPMPLVEAELKAYAKANPGLAAKKLDGRLVLYREGPSPASTAGAASGGSSMPLTDWMKNLFSKKGEEEKKIAFLSERRAALALQRDGAYEELDALEKQEATLKDQFKDAPTANMKKRITSQMLQLRKDLERRQQLLQVLNNQINVVSTHLHNLELVQRGQTANLPDTDEMTADAVKAEEVLAELEANAEIAGSVRLSAGAGGLTSEEQALFEELEAEAKVEKAKEPAVKEEPAKVINRPTPAEPTRQREASVPVAPPPIPSRARRADAEPG